MERSFHVKDFYITVLYDKKFVSCYEMSGVARLFLRPVYRYEDEENRWEIIWGTVQKGLIERSENMFFCEKNEWPGVMFLASRDLLTEKIVKVAKMEGKGGCWLQIPFQLYLCANKNVRMIEHMVVHTGDLHATIALNVSCHVIGLKDPLKQHYVNRVLPKNILQGALDHFLNLYVLVKF